MPTRRARCSCIGFFAVFLGAANAAGGYVVTERMLAMFKAGRSRGPSMTLELVRQGAYFVAAVVFIFGLKA
jgi:NAD/NADP transhydrogenase alpha subunit